jgi:hypothetical protein
MANPQLSLSPSQPLKKVSIPWVITISYLVVLLVLPAAALLVLPNFGALPLYRFLYPLTKSLF